MLNDLLKQGRARVPTHGFKPQEPGVKPRREQMQKISVHHIQALTGAHARQQSHTHGQQRCSALARSVDSAQQLLARRLAGQRQLCQGIWVWLISVSGNGLVNQLLVGCKLCRQHRKKGLVS